MAGHLKLPGYSPFKFPQIPPVNLSITILEMYLLYRSRGRIGEIYRVLDVQKLFNSLHQKKLGKLRIKFVPTRPYYSSYCTGINSAPRFGIIPYFHFVPDCVFSNTTGPVINSHCSYFYPIPICSCSGFLDQRQK